ncbi:MAG: alpha-2-macroglobulin family protein [Patescibacteria group bacterium]|nr:alpha-2-macroglobulin family protein [Patescibacteria group bacterium]
MQFNEELDAKRVDSALAGDQSKAQPEDVPYLRMAKALKAHAAWKEDEMDKGVMDTQKGHLLQIASNMKNAKQMTSPFSTKEKPAKTPGKWSRPWFVWAGGAVAVLAVVLLFFVTQTGTIPFKNLGKSTQMAGLSKLSLVIPEANAADAFSMLVERQDQGGADIDTSFNIQSKVSVDQNTLNQSLRVVKVSDQAQVEVPYDMKKTGDGQFNIKPQQSLDSGSVYRVVIATAVADDKGALRQRDFSWAIQTKDVFRVIRSVPAYASTGVPLDTAIEVMLSQNEWSDPAQYFEIQPSVKGRFETHGRTLVFLPEKPLATSTLYTVTYKKGWGVANSGLSLTEDHVIKFQTSNGDTRQTSSQLYLSSYLAESAPGTEPVILISSTNETAPIDVTGYSVTYDDAKKAIQEIESQPYWMDTADIKTKTLSGLAKDQAFALSVKAEGTRSWSKAIRLPSNLNPGVYVIKLQQVNGQPSWVILQISKLAAYMMADRDQILAWTINTETHKPLESSVRLEDQSVRADAQGLAYLKVPQAWQNTNSDQSHDWPSAVLDFGVDDMRLLAILRNPGLYVGGYGYYGSDYESTKATFNTWSYIFSDRPLYRSQDKINVFGLLQDRASGKGVGKAVVQIQNYGMLDFGTYQSKIFAQVELTTDDAGFWNGQLEWKGALSPGYYNIVLLKDGKQVTSRTVEIRDVVKPAYYIQVVPDKKSIFAGDEAKGQVVVKFYDGTPVSKAKVTLNASGGYMDGNQPMQVTTDDMGYAQYAFKTGSPGCNLNERYVNCSSRDTLSVEARPSVGEEGEIYAYASYNVWRSHLFLGSESEKENNGNAVMQYRVRQVDLSQENGREQDSVLTGGVPNVAVKAKVIEQHWDRTQTGNVYDPVDKKVVPQYRFDMRDVEAAMLDGQTDSDGRVTFTFPMKDGIFYRLLVWTESNGVQQAYTSYISKGWYNRSGDDVPTLVPTASHDQKNSYNLGEKVSLSFMQSGQKLASENTPFLFVHAARGLQQAQYSSNPTHEFEFTNQEIPNMTVYGVAFLGNGFVMSQYNASFDSQERELKVTLDSDETNYAPGEQAVFHAKVLNKDGNPVSDARVAVTVVDEALLAISQLDSTEQPLDSIYRWLPDGIIATNMTHSPNMENGFGGGGAEMGGGERANQVRRNFKDQATFMVLRTGSDGTATGSFTMPDNITSWRFTAAAVSPDLRAGSARLNVPATKPLFVDAVIPQNILISDKPILKVRAFGTALPKSGEVTYTVDIPTLGINSQQVKGPAGKAVYLALEHPVAGEHKAVISVSLDGSTKDAIERIVTIVASRATHDERVSMELAPGTELPDLGQSPEVELIFESKARSSARGQVEMLANPWSARLESAVAGRVARELLKDYYQAPSNYPSDIQVTRFQRASGGLAVLPYSSEDVALSSKVAAADPEGVDQTLLANYFWTVTDDQKVSREESIQALAGLAALGQPVVSRLHSLTSLSDLSWRETLALARGLESIGDREAARSLLESLLAKAQENDGLMQVMVSKSQAENIEATSEAAALAAAMSHPAAGKLMAYVESNWNNDALTDLDKMMYLQKYIPTLVPTGAKVTYAIGQETKTIDLKEQPIYSVRLTAEEAKAFRAVSVDGPVAVSFIKRAAGDTLKTSPLLNISREYQQDGKPIKDLHEGDLVTVSLTSSWDQKAQDGCYTLRDRLPAGFMSVVNISFDRYAREPLYYPYDMTESEVSFVVCKQPKPFTIKYLARIVSLGSYTAGGALLQSMDAPSLAAVSAPMTVEVK